MEVPCNLLNNIYLYVDFRTSYSGACVLGYQVEEGGVECHAPLAVGRHGSGDW